MFQGNGHEEPFRLGAKYLGNGNRKQEAGGVTASTPLRRQAPGAGTSARPEEPPKNQSASGRRVRLGGALTEPVGPSLQSAGRRIWTPITLPRATHGCARSARPTAGRRRRDRRRDQRARRRRRRRRGRILALWGTGRPSAASAVRAARPPGVSVRGLASQWAARWG